MGWWITLGILFLLAILPLGVNVRYDEDGIRARVIAGPIRVTVYPIPKWMKKDKTKTPKAKKEKKSKKKKKEPQAAEGAPAAKKKGGSLKDFLPLVIIGLHLLDDLRRKLRLDYLQVHLTLAGDDPCDLAVNYGRAWAAMSNLQPMLEKAFVVKKRDLDVQCDFTATQTLITARLDLTITLGRLLGLAAVYGVKALIEFLKIKKKKKAVQQNESKAS